MHAAVQGVLAQVRCAMGQVWWDKDTQLLLGVQYLNMMKNLKGSKKKTHQKSYIMSLRIVYKIWKMRICKIMFCFEIAI
jgi:hypothetical protein